MLKFAFLGCGFRASNLNAGAPNFAKFESEIKCAKHLVSKAKFESKFAAKIRA